MGDISFKISGTSQPFLVQLWNNDCSSLIQQKSIEYSGTCVIFGELNGNTGYNVNIVDNISATTSYCFTTLPSLPSPSLSIKYISLLGTLTCPNPYTRQITSPKCVSINPPLIIGESVDINFKVETINTSNTNNNINLYCNGNILTPSYSNCGLLTKQINMQYGDTICYDMSSYCTYSGEICGHSTLEITSVIGYGFSAHTDSSYCKTTSLSVPTTTTTTTTTTLAPLNNIIAVCRVGEIISDENKKTCGVINITPALSINQSISVNYCIDLVSAGLGYNKKVVQIYCRFAGSGGYVLKNEYMTEIDGSVCNYSSCRTTGNFNLNYGDEICYTNCSVSICPLQLPMNGNGSAFIINSVSNGILSDKDRDVLIG